MLFKFFLVRTVSWSPRFVQRRKQVIMVADNLLDARQTIQQEYPEWQVSMCWPIV
jgi:hypothetical protein